MKKPTTDRRMYAFRIAAKRARREARHTRVKWSRRRSRSRERPYVRVQILRAPAVFGLVHKQTRGPIVAFLRQLRDLVLVQKRKVVIDFTSTQRMFVDGTLLFAAEVDRLNRLTQTRPFQCIPPVNERVAQVLQHVGIAEMLGHGRRRLIDDPTVVYWKVHSGSEVEGQKAYEAVDEYKDRLPDPKKVLYRGLTEAMTNCVHHAYFGTSEIVKNWWMFSQLKDEKLTVALCDLGVGIPESLRQNRKGWMAPIQSLLTTSGLLPSDANLIKAAMELRRTRTKKRHRGKGLGDIRAVLDALGGRLAIHSGRGNYIYETDDGVERCNNFGDHMRIDGTLVVWQIPLPTVSAG